MVQSRQFTAENPKYGEPGEKKQLTFQLTCVFGEGGTKIKKDCITMLTSTQGLPMTSAAALRAMCGKPGVAKNLLKEMDEANVHAAGAAAAEALGDTVVDQPATESECSDSEHHGCSPHILHIARYVLWVVYTAKASLIGMCRMSYDERSQYQVRTGLGHLYMAFEDHKDGVEACAAVEALIEISAIETLRASFLLPLQGDAVSAEAKLFFLPAVACLL
jgi:hypothetical protein